MQQSNSTLGKKVGNPKAYAEAQRKAAPRKGLVVTMSIEAFCYYTQIHRLDILHWNGGVLMVKKQKVKSDETQTA